MISNGYILLHRSLTENWVWRDAEYLRAWVWLLMTANFEDREALIAGKMVVVRRGQLVTSFKTISKETGLSTKRARTFLENLEKAAMIGREKGGKWTRITICKYEIYQDVGQGKGKVSALNGANRGQTEGNTIKKERHLMKKNNEEKASPIPTWEEFKKYAIEKKPSVDFESLRWKYEAWREAGWQCGNPPRSIRNWKSTLLNTLPHIKESVSGRNSKPPEPSIPDFYDPNAQFQNKNNEINTKKALDP